MRLKVQEGLSVLDIGPTSHSNINFLTNLGHSVFMADIVEEANRPEWKTAATDVLPEEYDVEGFLEKHMSFGQRMFDVVLLWDALDYIPEPFVEPVIRRLHASMESEGELFGLFHAHGKVNAPGFCRYHLTDGPNIEMQNYSPHTLLHVYPNRAIQNMFSAFRNFRFFLAKDNLSEVIVTR